MPARGTADLPLPSGAAPAWLFRRMGEMAGAVSTLIVRDGAGARGGEAAARRVPAGGGGGRGDGAAGRDGSQVSPLFFLSGPGGGRGGVGRQGMTPPPRSARRYHWLSDSLPSYVADPHA